MQEDPAFARAALRAGALGDVLKDAADDELMDAVLLAARGRTYLNPQLGARLAAQPVEDDAPDNLSPRETEVLTLIALGHTNSEIVSLFLSVRTVESHRSHIQQKIGLSTRAELVGYARGRGLLD
jgi:two-component system response regulator NreC